MPGGILADVGAHHRLCNELVGLQFWLSLVFDADMREIDPVVAGVNHLPLVTSLRIGGEDGFAMLRNVLDHPQLLVGQPVWMTRRRRRTGAGPIRRGTGPRPTSWPTTA